MQLENILFPSSQNIRPDKSRHEEHSRHDEINCGSKSFTNGQIIVIVLLHNIDLQKQAQNKYTEKFKRILQKGNNSH